MSEAEKKTLSLSELVAALPGKIFRRDALLLVLTLVVGAGVYAFAQEKIDGGAEKAIAPVQRQLNGLRSDFEENKKDTAAAQRALRDDIHEAQLDVRELYRYLKTGRASERLEAPPKDGGQ